MIKKSVWLDMIIISIKEFSNPEEGFAQYESQQMNRYYNNYFNSIFITLYEDCLLEDIEDYKDTYDIPSELLNKLKKLRSELERFNKSCHNLNNFALIRRPEWDEIIPLAKECYEGLKKMEKAEKKKK